MRLVFLIISLLTIASPGVAEGNSVITDGKYYDWIVYHTDDLGEEKKCYIATFAKADKFVGNYRQKREPYLMITLFRSSGLMEVSLFADYEYRKNGSVYVAVGNRQFRMVAKGKMAWNKSAEEDWIMIRTMLEYGSEIKSRGETLLGEYTIDTFSSLGLGRAYERMKQLCRE
ncbi:MAG: hypothetical protein LBU15_04635 [Rickettsiales bacterium]|nr:hypothetical protein [Rickettsiales bacterium]